MLIVVHAPDTHCFTVMYTCPTSSPVSVEKYCTVQVPGVGLVTVTEGQTVEVGVAQKA